MYKNLQILRNKSIEISNSYIAEEYIIQDDVIIPIKPKRFEYNNAVMEHVYANFIELGKDLYNAFKDKILPYEFSEYNTIGLNATSNLINYSKDISLIISEFESNRKRLNIVLNWLSTEPEYKPIYLVPFRDELPDMKVELFVLCDIAIFSYLINSALAHYYLLNKRAKKFYLDAKALVDNEITIDKIMRFPTNIVSPINAFYNLLGMIFNTYDYHRKDRFLTSSLRFDVASTPPNFKRQYFDIISFYWDVLKLQTYSMPRNYCLVNICYCGSIIEGKSFLCDQCRLTNDALRKQQERSSKSKQKKKAN